MGSDVEDARARLNENRGLYREAEAGFRRARAQQIDAMGKAPTWPSAPPREQFEQSIDYLTAFEGRAKSRQGRLAEAEIDIRRALLSRLKANGKYRSRHGADHHDLCPADERAGALDGFRKIAAHGDRNLPDARLSGRHQHTVDRPLPARAPPSTRSAATMRRTRSMRQSTNRSRTGTRSGKSVSVTAGRASSRLISRAISKKASRWRANSWRSRKNASATSITTPPWRRPYSAPVLPSRARMRKRPSSSRLPFR